MNQVEFQDLHANCVAVMRAYFAEAEKTTALLADCSAEPLTFVERLTLMSQTITEREAHEKYLSAKKFLLSVARLGYQSLN